MMIVKQIRIVQNGEVKSSRTVAEYNKDEEFEIIKKTAKVQGIKKVNIKDSLVVEKDKAVKA